MVANSLMMSRVIVDELCEIETRERGKNAAGDAEVSSSRFPRRQY